MVHKPHQLVDGLLPVTTSLVRPGQKGRQIALDLMLLVHDADKSKITASKVMK